MAAQCLRDGLVLESIEIHLDAKAVSGERNLQFSMTSRSKVNFCLIDCFHWQQSHVLGVKCGIVAYR